jgi:hypothetical protein
MPSPSPNTSNQFMLTSTQASSMISPEGYHDSHPAEGTSPVGPVVFVGTPGGTVSQFIMDGPPFLQPKQHTWCCRR